MQAPSATYVLPNVLIAGFPKCGTTSVFETLARHPQVCGASVKEPRYFTGCRFAEALAPVREYGRYFENWSGEPVVLDGTPGYMYGEYQASRAVREVLGSPQVLVMMREPVDRAVSYFTWKKGRAELPHEMELDDYLATCEHLGRKTLTSRDLESYSALHGGEYAAFLPAWIDVFGADLKVAFVDDLKEDPVALYRAIASWLGIESGYFSSQTLRLANESGGVRMPAVERRIRRVGRRLRPLARRSPATFRVLRDGARLLNKGQVTKPTVSSATSAWLQEYFAESTSTLRGQVVDRTLLGLPRWLEDSNYVSNS